MEHFRMEFEDGSEFETTPDNTALYRFAGRLAIYNHVYLMFEDEDAYIFNQSPAYPYLEGLAIMNKYPVHDNLTEIMPQDVEAFNDMVNDLVEDIPDTVPEEWL